MKTRLSSLFAMVLAGCAAAPVMNRAPNHVQTSEMPVGGSIPATVQMPVILPKPKPVAKPETYSVVVNNVRVQELLFALARDAKLNVDIHPGISGTVTLNAIDQRPDPATVAFTNLQAGRHALGTRWSEPDGLSGYPIPEELPC